MNRIFVLVSFTFMLSSACATQNGQKKMSSCACEKNSTSAKLESSESSDEASMEEVSQKEVLKQVQSDLNVQKNALNSNLQTPKKMNFVYNQVIVKVRKEVDLMSSETQLLIQEKVKAKILSVKPGVLGTALVTFEDVVPARDKMQQQKIVEILSQMDIFEYAEANKIMHAM